MRIMHMLAATAAATLATLTLAAAPAHADVVPGKPFYADSLSGLDNCPHGITTGTLTWYTPGPMPAIAANLHGTVVDRPASSDARDCLLDDYSSTAVFTAYSGSAVLGQQAVTVDNGVKEFTFTLGSFSIASRVTHVVIQVCRDPIHTLPPSYCGRAVTYQA